MAEEYRYPEVYSFAGTNQYTGWYGFEIFAALDEWREVIAWLHDQFGVENETKRYIYWNVTRVIYLRSEVDATAFKIRWC